MTADADTEYERRWQALQIQAAAVRTAGGLGAAFERLIVHERGHGTIPGDPPSDYRVLHGPGRSPSCFIVQVNPGRRLRLAAATPGTAGDDMLDRDRIRRTSQGRQCGLDLIAPGSGCPLIVWAQPRPLAPMHCVIAAATPQRRQAFANSGISTIADLAGMACELGPEWMVIFNGGVGHTQPRWHLQAFQRPAGHGLYPLEEQGARTGVAPGALPLVKGYPITTLQFQGTRCAVVDAARCWLRHWLSVSGAGGAVSLMAAASDVPAALRLWMVPRQRQLARAAQFAEALAALEMLGEFPLTTDDELQRLANGAIGYETVASALASVEPPGVLDLLGAAAG